MGRATLLGVLIALCIAAAPAQASKPLANRCFDVSGVGVRHFKPTGTGTYLLYDGATLGPDAEWRVEPAPRGRYRLRANDGREVVARLRRARGCARYPEAALGARGRRARGTLRGFADAHVHIAASLRAGGRVISGEPFSPYGLPDALGRDADVHGPDGAIDVTGNLLRTGSPVGSHDTEGWPSFAGWPERDTLTHQQVYWRWLQRAWRGGLRLVVAQTVEDEPLCQLEPVRSHSCDETETLELQVAQLRALQRYVDAQAGGRGRGFFRLARGPREAARAIRGGKLAVVIGAESSNVFGCSQKAGVPACDRAGIDAGIERLHRAGIRGLFVAHWVDNALAGAALEGGDKGLFISAMQVEQTGEPFVTGDCPYPGQGEEPAVAVPTGSAEKQCNVRGLTELGEYAIRRLMDRHMLIELDHMSERARDRVLEIAGERDYPLISSHTDTGGTWARPELRSLAAANGYATARLGGDLAADALRLSRYRGLGVGLSSDTGGFASLPAPEGALAYPFRLAGARFARQRSGERVFDVNEDGMAHYGLLPDLLATVRSGRRGGRALRLLDEGAAAYLRTWRRTGAPG